MTLGSALNVIDKALAAVLIVVAILVATVLIGYRWVVDEEMEAALESECRLACRYEDYQSAGYDGDGKNVADGHQIPAALADQISERCKESCTL